MPALLDDAQIAEALDAMPDWERRGSALVRSVKAPDFRTGIRLVDEVATVAEDVNHHPDIDIRWTTVTFALTTHVAGGITAYDVKLAHRLDGVIDRLVPAA